MGVSVNKYIKARKAYVIDALSILHLNLIYPGIRYHSGNVNDPNVQPLSLLIGSVTDD